jgi:hypothetical protein
VGRRAGPSYASGTFSGPSLATHCFAPAGLSVSSHSWSKRFAKKPAPHLVGVLVQVTSMPLVMASLPLPVPKVLYQPRPWLSIGAPSGSGPT